MIGGSSARVFCLTVLFHLQTLSHGFCALREAYTVTVTFEGRSCSVVVAKDETLLEALERTEIAQELAMPGMPSDCRKGSCLTCAAAILGSPGTLLLRQDGLTPRVARSVRDNSLILTCSSYVRGNGLEIQLGESEKAWKTAYTESFQDDQTKWKRAAEDAFAKSRSEDKFDMHD